MGFIDTIKDRLNIGQDDGYYDDEFDDYYDGQRDRYDSASEPSSSKTGILGNTRRPEAESVSVYTRSGTPVGNNGGSASAGYGFGNKDDYESDYRGSSARGYDSYESRSPRGYETAADRAYESVTRGYDDSYASAPAAPAATHTQLGSMPTGATTDLGGAARMTSGQLPPYVLKPTSYDDVQMVVRRVRTNQPVVLSFLNTNIEVAKRILDFSLGLTCGMGGAVDELGDRAFVVLPAGIELSEADLDKLAADGIITR